MAPGDVFEVEAASDVYYVDVDMYATPEYGAVYIVDAERPAIVDAGMGTNRAYLFDAMESVGVDPADLGAIATTHVHLDHAGGVGYVAERAPDADVYVHPIGAPHLVDPERLVQGTKAAVGDQWKHYVDPKPVPESRIVEVDEGDAIDLGDRQLEVHHAPGHAPHQVVFHEPEDGVVFVADAAGIWIPSLGRGRESTPPSNFEFELALEDVETIRRLDPDVLCFPHFGPVDEDVDGVLADYEDVLTEWVEGIEATYDELEDDDAVVEYFVEHNGMEDTWGGEKARAETAMNVRGVLRYLKGRDA